MVRVNSFHLRQLAIASAIAVFAGNARAGLLFSDNFNRPDGNLNQSPAVGELDGELATGVLMQSQQALQPITGGQLGVASVNYSGTTSVRFNATNPITGAATGTVYDWASGSAGAEILAAGGMNVDFDWTAADSTGNWISFSAGTNAPDAAYTVVSGQTDSGILLGNNGSEKIFHNSTTDVNIGSAFTGGTTHHVTLSYDFTSWADGSPVTLNALIDGTLIGTQNFAWNNNSGHQYLELASQYANPLIDNFAVSTVPEPTSIGLLALGSTLLVARRRRSH